jgi:hypothetical protein
MGMSVLFALKKQLVDVLSKDGDRAVDKSLHYNQIKVKRLGATFLDSRTQVIHLLVKRGDVFAWFIGDGELFQLRD